MRMRALRHPCFLLLIPLAAALLLTGCAGSPTGANGPSSPTVTTSAKPMTTATPGGSTSASASPTAAAVTTDISKLGWVQHSALVDPEAVAVAPGAADTLLSCTGATNAGKTNPTITLSISADGGVSWQTANTPIFAGTCHALAISPADARDVALYSGTCRGDCGQSTQTLYATTDSGQHWALVSSDSGSNAGSVFGWLGTTLFANAAPAGTPGAPQQYLARGTNGGPFAWTTLPAAPSQLLARDNTLYAVTGSQASCAAAGFCSDLWTSTDLGVTWSRTTPAYQGNNLRVEALAAGTGALYAYDARAFAGPNAYPLYRSTDGGHTWQPLPQLANGMQAGTDAMVAPDGTVFVFYGSDSGNNAQPDGIYKLVPGAGAWQLVSPVVPALVHVITIQSDASGHPATLWGFEQIGDERYSLWSHPA